ncbi:hypothetical protein C1646_676611 [Rhizophagus diaphanus]|nr:hypothetical protein C1646_676611 [Rhizophagus diaphanus] [Rhizophagus sp. MUCL 43196]
MEESYIFLDIYLGMYLLSRQTRCSLVPHPSRPRPRSTCISPLGETPAIQPEEAQRASPDINKGEDLQAKRYLCSYFIPCSKPHGIFMWRPDIKNLEHISDNNIGKLIKPITKNLSVVISGLGYSSKDGYYGAGKGFTFSFIT